MHPRDLLNLARTSKDFRAVLMNENSAPFWRAARQQVEGLPDCPTFLSEPAYANLVFFNACHVRFPRNCSDVWDGIHISTTALSQGQYQVRVLGILGSLLSEMQGKIVSSTTLATGKLMTCYRSFLRLLVYPEPPITMDIKKDTGMKPRDGYLCLVKLPRAYGIKLCSTLQFSSRF